MARHRSPGGRCTVPGYLPELHADRKQVARRHGLPEADATAVIAAVSPSIDARLDRGPRPAADAALPRLSAGRRTAPVKAVGRANTVVGATAALGAVVTGSLMAVAPQQSADVAAAETTNLTPMDLASASQALAAQPAGLQTRRGSFSDLDSASMHAAMMPVTAPAESSTAADRHDLALLHKADRLADEAATVHAALSREAFLLGGGGKLDDWISLALAKMDMPQSLEPGLRKIIMKESQGNPKAINRWDSNARAGRPSQGLMQTIPSTYRAYVLPELAHLPITNPVANITAGVRYMVATYGLNTLLRGGRVDSIGRYLGY